MWQDFREACEPACLCPVPAHASLLNFSAQSCSVSPPNILLLKKRLLFMKQNSKSWPRVTQYWEFLLFFVCFSRHFCCALAGTPKSQTLLQSVVAEWVIWNHVIYLTPFHYLACRISVRNIPGPLTLFFFFSDLFWTACLEHVFHVLYFLCGFIFDIQCVNFSYN